MYNIIVAIITSALLILFAVMIMRVFFEKRQTTLRIMLLTCAGVFSLLVLTTLFPSPQMYRFHFAIVFIYESASIYALCFIISLNYKASIVRRIFAVLSALPVYFLANIWATFIVRVIYANSPNMTLDMGWRLVLVLTSLLASLISVLLRSFKNIKRKMTISPVIIITLVILMLCILMSYFYMLFVSRTDYVDSTYSYMMLFIHAIPVGFIILLFYTLDTVAAKYEDKIKSALNAQEKEYYFTQCRLMQESVENIKSIRHDMKFHLATAKDFIANNRPNDAKNYLNSLLGSIEENEIYSNTKNVAFDSIINYKLNSSKHENINLDIRLLIPCTLNIEVADIVTIMGNLLDNAIDAVSKVEDKMLKLDIEYSRESLYIQVQNTFDGVVRYDNEEQKQIVTLKSGSEHGHGLKNVRRSVEKYNGHFDISHEGNVFSAVVLLLCG